MLNADDYLKIQGTTCTLHDLINKVCKAHGHDNELDRVLSHFITAKTNEAIAQLQAIIGTDKPSGVDGDGSMRRAKVGDWIQPITDHINCSDLKSSNKYRVIFTDEIYCKVNDGDSPCWISHGNYTIVPKPASEVEAKYPDPINSLIQKPTLNALSDYEDEKHFKPDFDPSTPPVVGDWVEMVSGDCESMPVGSVMKIVNIDTDKDFWMSESNICGGEEVFVHFERFTDGELVKVPAPK